MEFEDILLDVGDIGPYQKRLILFFLLPSSLLIPWPFDVLFLLSVPDHWCNVLEVAASNLTIGQQRRLISPPSNPKCFMYDINYTEYLESGIYKIANDTQTKQCSSGWQYDKTNYDATAATQWNMFCEDNHYKNFVMTFIFVGSIIGTPIYGAVSDRIGRKVAFYITLIITALSEFASVFMTNFTAFVILKTISGSIRSSGFQIPFIIVMELIGPEIRTHVNGLAHCFYTLGLCFLPLVAYLTRNWVTLGLFKSSTIFLFLLYWPFLPESPRWLLSQERYDEALVILKKIGDTNGKSPNTEQLMAKLKLVGEKIRKEKTVDNVQNSSADLLRYPQLRKLFIIITVCWIANVMVYDGLQLNVYNLSGNEFLNFFLTAVAEIPGSLIIWYLMDRIGRRWSTAGAFLMAGFVCMVSFLVLELPYADIICSMLGKLFGTAAITATYQQTSELYPTVVRSLGMGMSSTICMIVALGLPYLVYLSVYGKSIPYVVIGTAAVIAGISATFLPETLNENLPQTISDAEEFGKNQKFFSFNRHHKPNNQESATSLTLQLKRHLNDTDVKEENMNGSNSEMTNQKISLEGKMANKLSTDEDLNRVELIQPATFINNLVEGKTNVLIKESHDQSYDNHLKTEIFPAADEQYVEESTDESTETRL